MTLRAGMFLSLSLIIPDCSRPMQQLLRQIISIPPLSLVTCH